MCCSTILTRLLTSRILFLAAGRAVLVARLVMLGISPLTSFILVLKAFLLDKLVISGILSSIFLIWTLYSVFLTILFFTALLSFFNQLE